MRERFRHCPSSGVSVICEFACCLDDDKKTWYFETRRCPLTWEKHPCHSHSLPVTVAQLDFEKLFVSGKYKCIQVLCDLDTRSGLRNTPEAFDKSFRQKEYQILSHVIGRKLETRCVFCGTRGVVSSTKKPGVPRGLQIFPAKRSTSSYLYLLILLSKLCTFKKRCQSVEYFFTDCICC